MVKSFKCWFLFLLLLLGVSNHILANKDPKSIQSIGMLNGLNINETGKIWDLIYYDANGVNPVTNTEIIDVSKDRYENALFLKINEEKNVFLPNDFTVTVKVDIEYTAVNSQTHTLSNIPLTVSYKKGAGVKYDASAYLAFKNARKFSFKVVDINTTDALIKSVIYLEATLQCEREYYFAISAKPQSVTGVLNGGSGISDAASVNWDKSLILRATNVDLEWSWIEEDAAAGYMLNNTPDIHKIFNHNSTRVNLDPGVTNYKIPMLYDGVGKVYIRLRATQLRANGTLTVADWTEPITISFNGHEDKLNWQATTSFAEDGKLKSVIQYFDGSLRGRQTVTKDNVNNNVVIAETFYDFQGRPAIQVLPAPSIENIIHYVKSYNVFKTNPADPRDFYDLVGTNQTYCSAPTGKLDKFNANGGAAQYYSDVNPELTNLTAPNYTKYIPDAKEYAYTETRYTPDATGRVMAQSGVGETHQIGSGKETKYFYGSVEQKQLDALFGTEAGDAKHYFKNMVRDANGQYSVSYVDMHGRTIATALAGVPPSEGVESLGSYQVQSLSSNLLQSNLVNGKSVESATSLLVTKAGVHNFHYELGPQNVQIAACNPPNTTFCYDCIYDVEIRIVNNCSGETIVKNAGNISFNTIDGICTTTNNTILLNFAETLAEGEYNIIKKLTIHEPSQLQYKKEVFESANICKTLEQFYHENDSLMTLGSNCNPNCTQCMEELGIYSDFRIKYLQQLGVSTAITNTQYDTEIVAAYEEAKESCDQICNETGSALAIIREEMLADMTPEDGQYAKIDQDLNGNGIIEDGAFTTTIDGQDFTSFEKNTNRIYNIFKSRAPLNNAAQQPVFPYQNPWNGINNTPDYFTDALGLTDVEAHGNLVPAPFLTIPELHTPEAFQEKFREQWAEKLLPYHPEYCKLKYAEQNLTTTYAFEKNLQNTTYALASTAGYLTNLINLDPFFAVNGPGAAYRTAMLTKMNTSMYANILVTPGDLNSTVSMWSLAYSLVFCEAYHADPIQEANCYATAPKTPVGFMYNASCSGDWNRVWENFTTMYLRERNNYIEEILDNQCSINYRELKDNKYERRFGKDDTFLPQNFTDLYNNATNDPAFDYNAAVAANDNLIQNYTAATANDACAGYIDSWKQTLLQCPQIAGLPINQKQDLLKEVTTALKQICKENADANAPFGASIKTINGVENAFDIAVKNILTSTTYNIKLDSLCHPYLISYPAPYGKQAPFADYITQNPKDECVCNRITALQIEQTGNSFPGILSAYIDYQYGVYIRPSLIDSLRAGCNGTGNCALYTSPIQVPAILTCTAPEKTCLSCNELATLKNEFKTALQLNNSNVFFIANPSAGEMNWNLALAQFFNYKTGLNKTWIEFANFENACNTYQENWNCKQLEEVVTDFLNNPANGNYATVSACEQAFAAFFNLQFGTTYTFANIKVLYLQYCGAVPNICQPTVTCTQLNQLIQLYFQQYGYSTYTYSNCKSNFTDFFNSQMHTNYNWEDIDNLYLTLCGHNLDVCDKFCCVRLQNILNDYKTSTFGLGWLNPNCETQFVVYFNNIFGTNDNFSTIEALYSNCGITFDPCAPPVSCAVLEHYINNYANLGGAAYPGITIENNPSGCSQGLTAYLNSSLNMNYSYEQWQLMFNRACGYSLQQCENAFSCSYLIEIKDNFIKNYTGSSASCLTAFTTYFNYANKLTYTPQQIQSLYELVCQQELVLCEQIPITDCSQLDAVKNEFLNLYPDPAGLFGPACQLKFTEYFNSAFGSQYTYLEIQTYYLSLCNTELNICAANMYATLNEFKNNYLNQFGMGKLTYTLARDLFTQLFNANFQPGDRIEWPAIQNIYAANNIPLNLQPNGNANMFGCNQFDNLQKAFNAYGFNKGIYEKCDDAFAAFYNIYCKRSDDWTTIWNTVSNCNVPLNFCDITPVQEIALEVVGGDNGNLPATLYPPRLCGLGKAMLEVEISPEDPCAYVKQMAWRKALLQYEAYKDSIKNSFDIAYEQKCLAAKDFETFTVTADVAEYHYTLYYYDQAGNLVKTVPPEGVKAKYTTTFLNNVAASRNNGYTTTETPIHKLTTEYRYNSLNQVVSQKTPDAGISNFWYDYLGRLVVSQNAEQALHQQYSYTLYDELGRIKEVGQKYQATPMDQTIAQNSTSLENWLINTGGNSSRTQITETVYDVPKLFDLSEQVNVAIVQKNLRNRVSYSMTKAQAGSTYKMATYYTYDIHGNVDHLMHHYANGEAGHQYKNIRYAYDLISGKVNTVSYQQGKTDAFYHLYAYDAENKLTDVKTSRDAVYWEQDAAYWYYKHGPLARVELGQLGVQGTDYAYTLQGWLKGVNSTAITPQGQNPSTGGNFDMGQDGTGRIAKDAFSFSLNYFNGDYQPIQGAAPFAAINPTTGFLPQLADGLKTGRALYNGNISSMLVNIPKIGEAKLYGYAYDQLNRIVGLNAYNGINTSNNSFTPVVLDDYKERVSYDANGNILSYLRNGTASGYTPPAGFTGGLAMDSLTYAYKIDVDGDKENNKLRHVKDAVTATAYKEDIDDQPDDNYDYDKIGNLIRDTMENINTISWTVYGKISTITKTNGTTINYEYDPTGNRISKSVTIGSSTKLTFYVRDASGNVMGVYEKQSPAAMVLTELHLYGSSRLGVYNVPATVEETIDMPDTDPDNIYNTNGIGIAKRSIFERGNKFFELSNHLGNVLVTISDKKLQVAPAAGGTLVDFYEADVVTASDYYPFGMVMPGRAFTAQTQYRYGFNGQEKSPEVSENSTTAEFWQYDSRIGRRFNIDPVYKHSPYECFGGNPIWFSDPYGLDTIPQNQQIANWEKGDKTFNQPTVNIGAIKVAKEIESQPKLKWYQKAWNWTKRAVNNTGNFLGNEVIPRVGGALKAAGGLGIMLVGAASSELGIGIPIFAFGLDYGASGLGQLWYGKPQQTLTEQTLVSTGLMQPHDANLLVEGTGTFLSLASIRTPNAANFEIQLEANAGQSTTDRLQSYVSQSAKDVDALGDAAFTPKQLQAIQRNPNLRPMFRGNRIDVRARQLIKNDPFLFHLKSNYSRGADFVDPTNGNWWDMTTPASWRAHVNKYGSGGTLLHTQ